MIYYANPSTEQIRDEMMAGRLGCITTPHQGNVTFPSEWDVIADNGCFSDKWSERHWWEWLRDQPRSVRFAVCPDVFDPGGAGVTKPVGRRGHHRLAQGQQGLQGQRMARHAQGHAILASGNQGTDARQSGHHHGQGTRPEALGQPGEKRRQHAPV